MSIIQIAGQEINFYQLEIPIENCNTPEKMRAALSEVLEKIGEVSFVECSIIEDEDVSINFEIQGPLIPPPANAHVKLVSWYIYEDSTYSIDTDEEEVTLLVKTHLGTKYLIGYRDGTSILNAENNDSDDWTGNMVSIMVGDATEEHLDALAEVLTENETTNITSKNARVDEVAQKFYKIILDHI